jgi:citronellol/citronellal dehydrogenase
MQMIPGVDWNLCRKPEILADAAYDDTVLAAHGITDLGRYAVTPGNTKFLPDFFVD